jgi:hypothetical protein
MILDFKKIDNLLYVPINKEGNSEEWCFLSYKHINFKDSKHKPLKERLENDYVSICWQLVEHFKKAAMVIFTLQMAILFKLGASTRNLIAQYILKFIKKMFLIRVMLFISKRISCTI